MTKIELIFKLPKEYFVAKQPLDIELWKFSVALCL